MSGIRNANVPKTATRISNAIGIAIKNSPFCRSSSWIGSRSDSIAAWPVTERLAPSIVPAAARTSSV